MLLAQISFWGANKGGRFSKPQPNYQPELQVEEVYTTCFINPVDNNLTYFEFDKPYLVTIRLLFPERYENKLVAGQKLNFFEGSKKVGEGILIDFLES